MYVCVCSCLYICIYSHEYIDICGNIYLSLYTYFNIYIYICFKDIYIYIHIHIHILYIYIYIHSIYLYIWFFTGATISSLLALWLVSMMFVHWTKYHPFRTIPMTRNSVWIWWTTQLKIETMTSVEMTIPIHLSHIHIKRQDDISNLRCVYIYICI